MPAEPHLEKGPLDRQQVFELTRDLLADILEIEPTAITESSSFAEDLNADSLALIELVEGLEEELSEDDEFKSLLEEVVQRRLDPASAATTLLERGV